MKSRSFFKLCLLIIISLIFCIDGGSSFTDVYAYTSDNLPAGDKTIDNIYDEVQGRFLKDNLNALAKCIKDSEGNSLFNDLSEMITATEKGEIKTSADFGETVIDFGSYTFNNISYDLSWMPVYLSNSDVGPILTLWLSNTADENGGISNQEVSTWSNGTYGSGTKTFNGSTIYSSTYDGSYIRNYILNGSSKYTTAWGSGTEITPPAANTMTKFAQFTTGVLSSYIVTPENVSWQREAAYQKNDPKWNASGAKGTGANYPSAWTSDKLWLPSLYELYDSTIQPNSVVTRTFNENGGLWKTGDSSNRLKRSNSISSWLRSGYPAVYDSVYFINDDGSFVISNVVPAYAVRPAIHLNLKAAASATHIHVWENAESDGWVTIKQVTCTEQGEEERVCTAADCDLPDSKETRKTDIDATAHSWGEWEITAATCTSAGEKMRVCKNNSEHSESEVIPGIGHEFSTEFTIDTPATCTTAGSKSKHCTHAGCNEKTEVTEIAALQHDWGEWTVETAVTCEQDGLEKRTCKRSGCGESETRTIAHEGHKYVAETTPPTCTEDGYTTHACSVCGNSYTDGIIKAAGHSYGQPLWEWNGYLSATAAFECGNCNDCQTVPAMIANKVTKEPTYTEQGERTYTATVTFGGTDYTDSKTEAIDMNSKAVNSITFHMSNTVYGEEWEPSATALYGTVNFSYSNELGGTYAATKPQNVGTYYVKASVEEGETYLGAEVIKEFKITPREITVTINSGSSIAGDPLETLTATVTVGSVIDGDNPYTLSTNADMSVVGTYAITGTCTDGNYSITFVDGVYIVSQRASDPSGGGEIDIPRDDIDVEFKLTQSSTDRDYSTLNGMKKGYWAQLWYRNEDGTLGDEFTDKMNCVLTLKIPTEIIEGIRGGEKIDRDKIAAGLGVYYVEGGEFVAVKAFTIAQKDDNWIVKFNYNAEFPAEIVFNAADAEDGQGNANGGTPWWVWLLVCLGGAAVIGVIVVIIVVAKKKNTAAVAAVYDDAELKAKLIEQDRKLDEIKEIVDGGFNDLVDGE